MTAAQAAYDCRAPWFRRWCDPTRCCDPTTDALWERAFWVFFGIVALVAYGTFAQYGISWDEHFHHAYGEWSYGYYASGFKDRRAFTDPFMHLYGALFDLVSVIAIHIVHKDDYLVRHFINTSVGLLGILGVWYFGRFIAGRALGFIAAAVLVLTPSYYGHMFNNPKDIPFAVGYLWSLYFITRLATVMPNPRASLIIKAGVAIGLTLSIRIGALLLFAYLGLATLVSFAAQVKKSRDYGAGAVRLALRYARAAVLVFMVAYIAMLPGWPWALENPFHAPLQALREMSHFPWYGVVLFRGKAILNGVVPWTYLPVYYFVKLPVGVLLGLASFLLVLVASFVRKRWPADLKPHVGALALLAFAIVFPWGYVVAKHSVLYDAERHFLFILPPLVLLSGLGIYFAFSILQRSRAAVATLGALAAVYIAFHVATLVRLHPYQYVFYNAFVGGLKGAYGRYETDYWVHSYRAATEQLKSYIATSPAVAATASRRPPGYKYSVQVCGIEQPAAYYFGTMLRLPRPGEAPDFFIGFTRYGCPNNYAASPVLFTIAREGVPLSIVKAVAFRP